MRGTRIGQKNGVDLIGRDAGAFVQTSTKDDRRQAGIDQNMLLADADQRSRRVRRAKRLSLVPKPVAAQRAYADDVNSNRHSLERMIAVRECNGAMREAFFSYNRDMVCGDDHSLRLRAINAIAR